MRLLPSPGTAGALAAGAATVLAFEPFGHALLPIATLGFLFALWHDETSACAAAWRGLAFGLGLFGAGASWVYIALEHFGGMPPPLAALGTAGFVAWLAVFPALTGYVAVRFTPPGSWLRALAAAAGWPLAEWLRGTLFTGFPWLALGYAELPGSTLAGFAPLGGVWLVSLAVALVAACFAVGVDALARSRARRVLAAAAVAVVLFAAGAVSSRIEWTQPAGAPIAVSLVQGNIAQDIKFDPTQRARQFADYVALAAQTRGRLVVLPESAFPVFAQQVPEDVLRALVSIAGARDGALLTGMFTLEPPPSGDDEPRVYNSVVALGDFTPQVYRKAHLVPFGETIPLKPVFGWLIRNVLAIPLADQTPGPRDQPPFAVAGERVAVDICYEDAFGGELRAAARESTLMVNVTNDAWYGRSVAARQHNQIAAMRALEAGRPMLRATNTGITSAIAHDGREIARLPWFTRGVLEVEIAGRKGDTPFLVFGDAAALLLSAVLLALAGGEAWRSKRGPAA